MSSFLKQSTKNAMHRLQFSIMAGVLMFGGVATWYNGAVEAGVAQWTPPSVSMVTTAREASCALVSGKVYCWGTNTYGQLGTATVAINGEALTPVAVDTNGEFAGRTVTAIKGNNSRTVCAVADGKSFCWGRNYFGTFGNGLASGQSQVPVPTNMAGVLAGKTVTKVTPGDGHTCAVASGAAYCWGTNGSGRLGDGTSTERLDPAAVSTAGVLSGKIVTDITAGSATSCAVADGKAYCWGHGVTGQRGDGTNAAAATSPVAVDTTGVLNGKTITSISGVLNTFCATSSDGGVYCWGQGTSGQLGNGASVDSNVPVAVGGALTGKVAVEVSAGSDYVCARDNQDNVYCWGGSTGNGTYAAVNTPITTSSYGEIVGQKIKSVSAAVSSSQSCAASYQKVYCWGGNQYGQLGNNSKTGSTVAIEVKFNHIFNTANYRFYQNTNTLTPGAPLASTDTAATLNAVGDSFRLRTGIKSQAQFTQVASAGLHACGLADGKVYCWGRNDFGQLGNNNTTNSPVPVPVVMDGALNGKAVVNIAAGSFHTCAVASDGAAYCWGRNTTGQLGTGNTNNSSVPVAVNTSGVLNGKVLRQISGGAGHTCATAVTGEGYCWGAGGDGRLGNGIVGNSLNPVAVVMTGALSGKSIEQINAGNSHTCAVAGGAAYCWGSSLYGRLGNTPTADASSPAAVDTSGVLAGKVVTQISAGLEQTCAVASGAAYCWGRNSGGQLGNSTTVDSPAPVAVTVTAASSLAGKTVTNIAAGGTFSCVLDTAGGAHCWGVGNSGELGNGISSTRTYPVAVVLTGSIANNPIKAISTGSSAGATCVMAGQQPHCWGSDAVGQLGDGGANTNSNVPVPVSVDGIVPGAEIRPNDNTYKLRFAQKSAATCSLQTGYNDVTNTSVIAYAANAGVANGAAVSQTADDPVPTNSTVMQTYQGIGTTTFTNTNTITAGKTGLWDFALKDNGAAASTSYCLKITYSDGIAVEGALAVPELITSSGVLSLAFVDAADAVVANPTFAFNNTPVSTQAQSTTATFGTSSQRLKVFNSLSTTGWTVGLAATGGPTAAWQRSGGGAQYAYNSSTNGQLAVNPTAGALAPQAGCTVNGLSLGSAAAYNQGVIDSITLLNATSSAQMACGWYLTGVGLTQQIPAAQPTGSYSMDVTATVVAQ